MNSLEPERKHKCFNIGVGSLRKKKDVLKDVWNTVFVGFPTIERCKGANQAHYYAATQYKTISTMFQELHVPTPRFDSQFLYNS